MMNRLNVNLLAMAGLVCSGCLLANAQSKITTEKMVNAQISPQNELVVVASETSSAHDFDYLQGKWTMQHK